MTVSDQIIQVLDALCEKSGMVIDWTNANVIPYATTLCTKLITYEIWTSIVMLAVSIITGIAAIVLFSKSKVRKFMWDEEIFGTFAFIGWLALAIFSIIVFGVEINDIIKCITFPELYIFEYIQGVLNAGG